MAQEPDKEFVTRHELTIFEARIEDIVRKFVLKFITQFHAENGQRFSEIEKQLSENKVALAVIGETNISQNREIANIGTRQAERYEQQRREEERASSMRHKMANTLEAIQNKMFIEGTAAAKREGREEVTQEYWKTGKEVTVKVAKSAAGLIGFGAIGKALWEAIKRWLHHG